MDVSDAEIDRAIVALADPLTMFKDASEDPEASEGIIARLPQLVSIVSRYWLERSQKPRARKGAAKASPAKPSAVRTGASKPNAARTPAKPAAQSQTVHRLRIALRGVRPPVWRRLEVPSDTKLPALNQILQAAMGWMDMHLHAFRVRGVSYGVPDPDFPCDMRDERRVTLGEIAPRPKSRFVFEYDFGDGWEHDVTVEAIEEAKPGFRYPCCLAGKYACPPEDCGGPSGYEEMLEALHEPAHEEHMTWTRWAGDFDPDEFNLEEVDAALATFAPSTRTRKPRRKRA
ncbi:MAG: plasmid pRiA4b ORF-3 family protein [Candidatus Baltobacteraceae bacterium]